MSSRGRHIEELPSANTIGANDLFVISVGTNNVTSTIDGSALKSAIVAGPFDDDAAANTGGVEIGHLYYTSAGAVQVRLV